MGWVSQYSKILRCRCFVNRETDEGTGRRCFTLYSVNTAFLTKKRADLKPKARDNYLYYMIGTDNIFTLASNRERKSEIARLGRQTKFRVSEHMPNSYDSCVQNSAVRCVLTRFVYTDDIFFKFCFSFTDLYFCLTCCRIEVVIRPTGSACLCSRIVH